MKTCPFFGKCGGCSFDFTATDYREKKLGTLKKHNFTAPAIWTDAGHRRRGDFCFAGTEFGLYESGTKNIIPVHNCPNMTPAINQILPTLAKMPWCGAGACLVTECENGLDIAITSNLTYFTPEFRQAAEKLPVMRITWNGKVIKQNAQPTVKFQDTVVDYPSGAFLQPTVISEKNIRQLVLQHADGARRVADLFCGLGNFTFALNADGFDVVGTGVKRDLFKNPLTVGMLNQYDCVVMDPPRAGALAQCEQLIKSNVKRIIYVSCNPNTFSRDEKILNRGGYHTKTLIPIDQFVGSAHWELFAVFEK